MYVVVYSRYTVYVVDISPHIISNRVHLFFSVTVVLSMFLSFPSSFPSFPSSPMANQLLRATPPNVPVRSLLSIFRRDSRNSSSRFNVKSQLGY